MMDKVQNLTGSSASTLSFLP